MKMFPNIRLGMVMEPFTHYAASRRGPPAGGKVCVVQGPGVVVQHFKYDG